MKADLSTFKPSSILDVTTLYYCSFCFRASDIRSVHHSNKCNIESIVRNRPDFWPPDWHKVKTVNYRFNKCYISSCKNSASPYLGKDILRHLKGKKCHSTAPQTKTNSLLEQPSKISEAVTKSKPDKLQNTTNLAKQRAALALSYNSAPVQGQSPLQSKKIYPVLKVKKRKAYWNENSVNETEIELVTVNANLESSSKRTPPTSRTFEEKVPLKSAGTHTMEVKQEKRSIIKLESCDCECNVEKNVQPETSTKKRKSNLTEQARPVPLEPSIKNTEKAGIFKLKSPKTTKNRNVGSNQVPETIDKLVHNLENYNTYILKEAKSFVLQCKFCSFKTNYAKSITRHLASLHYTSISETLVTMPDESKSYRCIHCGLVFPCKKATAEHYVDVHMKRRSLRCKLCMEDFKCRKSFEQHVRTAIHRLFYGKSLKCPVCPFATMFKDTLRKHTVGHGDPNKHSYVFSTQQPAIKAVRKAKTRVETSSIVYNCDRCEFTADVLKKLRDHKLKVHWVEKNSDGMYSCSTCSFNCTSKTKLRKHVSTSHKS